MITYRYPKNEKTKGGNFVRRDYAKLKGILAEKDIKNTDIARLLRLSNSSITNKLNRNNGMDFKASELKKICEAYNIDANTIFFG